MAKYILPYYIICDSIEFDMQHDHVLKKVELRPPRGGWVGVCEQNICYHDSVFMIPCNLICNMTIF